MATPIRIGIIGLDTSHATAFTSLLNDPRDPNHVAGGKVTVAYPGGSSDWPLSRDRVAGFTEEVRSKHGVQIVDSPEAVADAVDLLFIESVDGRVHLDQFRRTVKFKKPTFIDKPLACKYSEAQEIVKLARENKVPIMSGGSIRFADNLVAALAEDPRGNPVTGCDVFGPLTWQPTQPGWFWYGIHLIEALVTVMGAGCKRVRVTANEHTDFMEAQWADGRVASVRGFRSECRKFGVTLHRQKDFKFIDTDESKRPVYACLVDAIMRSLPRGLEETPLEQTLEIIHILEAANQSRETGSEVSL